MNLLVLIQQENLTRMRTKITSDIQTGNIAGKNKIKTIA